MLALFSRALLGQSMHALVNPVVKSQPPPPSELQHFLGGSGVTARGAGANSKDQVCFVALGGLGSAFAPLFSLPTAVAARGSCLKLTPFYLFIKSINLDLLFNKFGLFLAAEALVEARRLRACYFGLISLDPSFA